MDFPSAAATMGTEQKTPLLQSNASLPSDLLNCSWQRLFKVESCEKIRDHGRLGPGVVGKVTRQAQRKLTFSLTQCLAMLREWAAVSPNPEPPARHPPGTPGFRPSGSLAMEVETLSWFTSAEVWSLVLAVESSDHAGVLWASAFEQHLMQLVSLKSTIPYKNIPNTLIYFLEKMWPTLVHL